MKDTPNKEELIKLIQDGFTLSQIAKYYNRSSASSARLWLKKYGLQPNRPTKQWTKKEDEFLIRNYPDHGRDYCSKHLNRSKDAIYKRVGIIGVERNFNWQKLDKTFLEKQYRTKSITRIAEETKMNFWDVYAALIHYNIEIDRSGKYFGKDHHNWAGFEEIPMSHWSSIERSAKRRSRTIPFNITPGEAWDLFLEQNKRCALSGVEIYFSPTGANRYSKTTASLDRIDSFKGYSKDNCQWVHKEINRMKLNMSEPDFVNWCERVCQYNKDKKCSVYI